MHCRAFKSGSHHALPLVGCTVHFLVHSGIVVTGEFLTVGFLTSPVNDIHHVCTQITSQLQFQSVCEADAQVLDEILHQMR